MNFIGTLTYASESVDCFNRETIACTVVKFESLAQAVNFVNRC